MGYSKNYIYCIGGFLRLLYYHVPPDKCAQSREKFSHFSEQFYSTKFLVSGNFTKNCTNAQPIILYFCTSAFLSYFAIYNKFMS